MVHMQNEKTLGFAHKMAVLQVTLSRSKYLLLVVDLAARWSCCYSFTLFENHRKSLIQHCERSELRLHFEWTKVHFKKAKNGKNGQFWRVFEI